MRQKFMPALTTSAEPTIRALALALLACASLVQPCAAQSSAQSPGQTSVPLSAPRWGASIGLQSQGGYQPSQRLIQPDLPLNAAQSPQWNPSTLDSFQPPIGLGNFTGSEDTNFRYSTAGAQRVELRSPSADNIAWLGAVSQDRHQESSTSLFPLGIGTYGSAGRPKSQFGATAGGELSLTDLMRGNLNRKSNPSFGSLQPARGTFLSGAAFADSFQPPPLSALITSDLGNGVLFSAGANNAGHSSVGAAAAGFGPAAGSKHSGASVGLKLSF